MKEKTTQASASSTSSSTSSFQKVKARAGESWKRGDFYWLGKH